MAFDAKTGNKLWTAQSTGNFGNSPAVSANVVYVGDDASMFAFNATTGDLVWTANVSGPSTPAVWNGAIYVGSSNSDIIAFDAATGQTLWSTALPAPITFTGPTISNGVLYTTAGDNYLYALDARNGNILWSYNLPGFYTLGSASQPAIVDGTVFVGLTFGYRMFAFALPAGNALFQVDPASVVIGTPVTLRGNGFTPNEPVRIYINGLGSNVLSSVPANSQGASRRLSSCPQLASVTITLSHKARSADGGRKRRSASHHHLLRRRERRDLRRPMIGCVRRGSSNARRSSPGLERLERLLRGRAPEVDSTTTISAYFPEL
jgi:hypothetical protein